MSSGKTKEFSVSGASTPLTAVAAEPLSIAESVPPIAQVPVVKPSGKKSLSSQILTKASNGIKKDSAPSVVGTGPKDTVEVINIPAAGEAQEAQDTLPKAHKNGSPTHSAKGSISSSLSITKLQNGGPSGGKGLNADQESQQQSTSETPSPRDKIKEGGSGKKYNREALLEEYHSLQKERKALRKRNIQAQTNIAQYMRKHR